MENMEINEELKKYIEKNVFPEYNKNEPGHGINHINDVINRSFELIKENGLDLNQNMVYTIAAYHDIGHHIDSKTHEIISADIMSKDKGLFKFFSNDELKTIKEAIEDHRASSNHEPRSIYGKIVASADRSNSIEECLERTYTYGKKHNPNATDDELFLHSYNHLVNKFGINGHAKFYFKDIKYETFLKDLRELLSDKTKYIETQRGYISTLKKKENCKEKILVSSCLLGLNCRYDGGNNYSKEIDEFLKDYEVIPICPEIMGGLPTPRIGSERIEDKVITKDGRDVTEQYIKGAEECVYLAKKYGIKKALLKLRSPSCGSGKIYDGTFTHTLKDGYGVTAELLKKNGVTIITIK